MEKPHAIASPIYSRLVSRKQIAEGSGGSTRSAIRKQPASTNSPPMTQTSVMVLRLVPHTSVTALLFCYYTKKTQKSQDERGRFRAISFLIKRSPPYRSFRRHGGFVLCDYFSATLFLTCRSSITMLMPSRICPMPATPEIAAFMPAESSVPSTCGTPRTTNITAVRFRPT